jgi:hypothetical protein
MKRAILLTVLVLGATIVFAQEKPAEKPQQPPMPGGQSMEEMMKQAQQMAAPAEQHQDLAKLEGQWKVNGKFMMPGAPPMTFTGTNDCRMILGGRFLRIEGKAQSAQPGMNSESLTVLGYDKRTGKYTLWGIDTYGTYSINATGDWDEATKTATYLGENEEPGMGKVPFKFVVHHPDDDHYTLELHMQFPGMGWHKMMEATHERA